MKYIFLALTEKEGNMFLPVLLPHLIPAEKIHATSDFLTTLDELYLAALLLAIFLLA